MEKEIKMPKLRPEMKEAVLCAWLKNEGDRISVGEPIFEIETDKVVNQVESTENGVLKKTFFEEGDTVAVDEIVATVDAE
ncbi:MAG: biotin/lipoyl-containing protein [Eubacteriales bacterium]|nr:biotin attachment protein [Clostridiales bacterium]MDD6341632.1 biotin attachment protein [Eubacteriales bacterium]MDD7393413.1 biotin attachment protein [Eubacteriales bacterium]MDY3760149.1 biotin/lipoyl-containing protein [Eubacteriales bacterium]